MPTSKQESHPLRLREDRALIGLKPIILPAGVLGVLMLTGCGGPKGPTYSIKLKDRPDAGNSLKQHNTISFKGTIGFDIPGKTRKDQPYESLDESIYTVTTLAGGPPRPTRFERHYEKAVQLSGITERQYAYQGRTIVFEWKGDKYQGKTKEEPSIAPGILAKLARDASTPTNQEMLGLKGPVSVGESWSLDPQVLGKIFHQGHGEVLPDKTKGTAKLVKVYEKDGGQWGTIEVDLSMTFGHGDPDQMTMSGTLVSNSAIDGSSTAGAWTFEGKMSARKTGGVGVNRSAIVMNGQLSIKEEQTAEEPVAAKPAATD